MTEQTTETAEVAPDSLITPENEAVDFATKPEGFPDDFWDAEKNSPNVDKLYKEFQNRDKIAKDLRVKLSKGEFTGKPPEDIAEYTVELAEELKPLVPDDDPLFNAARQAAKDAGLPKEAFAKFMTPVIEKLAEMKQQMEAPLSEEQLQEAKNAEIAKLGQSGHRIVSAVGKYIDTLQASGTFSAAEAKAAKDMATTAEAVRVLNKFRMMSGGQDQVPVDMPVDDRASKADIESKMAAAMLSQNEAEYNKYAAMLAKYN
jgi:hypothetical protein